MWETRRKVSLIDLRSAIKRRVKKKREYFFEKIKEIYHQMLLKIAREDKLWVIN